MNIQVECKLSKMEDFGTHLFRRLDGLSICIPLLALFIVSAFISESSIVHDGGAFRIQVGGGLSFLGLLVSFSFLYHCYRLGKVLGSLISFDDIYFCELSENGIRLGIRDVSIVFYAWNIVSEIKFRHQEIVFTTPRETITLSTHYLTEEQTEELVEFFSKTRKLPPPSSFFRWPIKQKHKLFGPLPSTFQELVWRDSKR